MNKHLANMKLFPPEDLRKIAALHVAKFKKRVVNEAKDANGRNFPPYSKGYRKLIEKGFRKKDGTRYKGFESVPLSLGDKLSKRPFKLRGITVRNLSPRKAGTDYYEIGWDGEPAAIVEGNSHKGRDIISTIPDDEFNWVLSQLGRAVDKEWKKVKDVTFKVSL